MADTLCTADNWRLFKEAFIRPRKKNIQHVFRITEKLWDETVKHFFEKLNQLAKT